MIAACLCVVCSSTMADDPTGTFAGPDALEVRTELLQWVVRAGADETVRDDVLVNWADDAQLAQLSDEDLLDHLVVSFALADPSTQRLLESSWSTGPLEEVVYDGIRDLDFYRNQLELYRARWMTQHRLFDEALQIYDQLSPDDVIDPAGLFFYRAVCQSELLQRDAALDSLSLLLDHTLEVPSRFRMVATILQKELGGRKDDDLGHVSRLMADAGRQLDLGRSGERVQQRQGQVIDAIDRLLEEAENQKQGQGKQGEGGQGQPSPSNPAQKSRIHGWADKGEADRREVKETGGWGMLDRRKEAKARELIRQQFPANYLDIISEYNRRIAEQK
jgi:hypothetical protein